MELQLDNRRNIIESYKPDVQQLLRYLPWLMQKRQESLVQQFDGNGEMEMSFQFPVYDSTLLNFVKTAQKTKFMNRNYQYVYTRNRIRSAKEEIAFIKNATLQDMEQLGGILSKYIMGGMTKGSVWPEGVQNGVYEELLTKLKELMEITTI